jgi:HD-like signal output (HDOD) protein
MPTATAATVKPSTPQTGAATAPTGSDSSALVQAALRKVTTIATLPEVTAKIIKTVEDKSSTATQLHQIISHDPALVTRILKVVNSAFYGLPGQIGSVERAIVLLGLNAIKNIAVAASLGQLFRGVELCQGFAAKDLWTHCIAVGVTAREIARQMRIPLGDEAFLAGMIHDIGILVLLQTNPEKLREVCDTVKTKGGDFCTIERDLMGIGHQELGKGLAEMWKFPRACQLVAGFHHQPQALSNDRLLTSVVYVADTVVAQANHGFNLTALHQKLDDAGLGDATVDPGLIDRIKQNLPNLIASASNFA